MELNQLNNHGSPKTHILDFYSNFVKQTKWDESTDNFLCLICKKTFYNAVALQNHKNQQHDMNTSSSETEPNVKNRSDQIFDGICGFKFLPAKKDHEDPVIIEDGLTKRVFGVDTSYLIVRVEGDVNCGTSKRSRLDSIKRTQIKPDKPPVDLRGPFTCTLPSTLRPDMQCRQIFFNCCEYSMHYREQHTKHRKAALRCQVCEKRLDRDFFSATTTQLITHNPETFSCRICGQIFLNSAQYDEHNRLVHAKMKPYQCTICAKRFTQQGGLQQHMRMHTGIRPFVCTFCSKAFTQKAGLDQHLRTHTKVKPFKCIICSKCFSQSVHLRQHMRTHTNIQPFECPACGRRFKQSSHLNFHMRSHVGDSSLIMQQYAQVVQQHGQMEYLNLSNVQPVQDGETLYYAAELETGPRNYNPYVYPEALPDNIMSL